MKHGHRRVDYLNADDGEKFSRVPDRRSRDLEVVVVRHTINLGAGNLGWGGNGRRLRRGRSVYE
jgi:hypothetical protein